MQSLIIQKLASRHSVGAKFLTEPVPTAKDFEEAAQWASAAPDHCRLHPARFVIIENRAKLADFFESGALSMGADAEEAAKARSKAAKAPAVVAVIAKISTDNARVPEYEQWMTVGAAVSNFLSALEIKGFGGKIVSGSSTKYPDAVKAFCRKDEVIACWIMLGTPKKDAPTPQPREPIEQLLTYFS